MSNDKLASTIDEAFEARDKIGPKTKGAVRKAVNAALELLDSGKARVAERKPDGHWQVNQWLKKAVLLSFRLNDMSVIPGGPGKAAWWDKVDSKFKGWSAARFRKAGFRAVPGCVVRRSAFIALIAVAVGQNRTFGDRRCRARQELVCRQFLLDDDRRHALGDRD